MLADRHTPTQENSPANTVKLELIVPLPERDQEQLKHCEEILRRGLSTFFEVG